MLENVYLNQSGLESNRLGSPKMSVVGWIRSVLAWLGVALINWIRLAHISVRVVHRIGYWLRRHALIAALNLVIARLAVLHSSIYWLTHCHLRLLLHHSSIHHRIHHHHSWIHWDISSRKSRLSNNSLRKVLLVKRSMLSVSRNFLLTWALTAAFALDCSMSISVLAAESACANPDRQGHHCRHYKPHYQSNNKSRVVFIAILITIVVAVVAWIGLKISHGLSLSLLIVTDEVISFWLDFFLTKNWG